MNKMRTKKNGSPVKEHPKRIFAYFPQDNTPYVEWGLNDEITGDMQRRLPLQVYHGDLQFQA